MTRDELNVKYCIDEMTYTKAVRVLQGFEPGDKKAAEKVMNYEEGEWFVSFKDATYPIAHKPWVERVIHCKSQNEAVKKAKAQIVSRGFDKKFEIDLSKPLKVDFKKNWNITPYVRKK